MTELEYLKKYLHPEDDLETAIKRLNNGEPVQYIIGDVEFYGNIIDVNHNILIPRPETEELVEKCEKIIKEKYLNQSLKILDIGTGSGCIAISLKKIFPFSEITAIDISQLALETAKKNAIKNKVDINFIKSDIFSSIKEKYDIIISNPPYIKEDEPIMDIVKNNEPHIALYAPNNGLYFYETILKNAHQYLNKKSIIAFEIGESQGKDIYNIAKNYFPQASITIEKDLRKFDRFIFIINE